MADLPLFAGAAPVFKVDGSVVSKVARDLLRLEIEESTAGLRTLAVQVVATPPDMPSTDVVEYLDGSVFDFGRRVEASMGPPGAERTVFTGTVSSIEVIFVESAAPHVTVLAEDLATRDRRPGTAITLTQGADLLAVSARADLVHRDSSVGVSVDDAGQRDRIDATTIPASTIRPGISRNRTGTHALSGGHRFVTVRGTTNGTADILVGSRLTLRRCGKPFDGDGYYVTRFRHTYESVDGFRTRFEAERATVNG